MQTIAQDTGRHQLGFRPLELEQQIDRLEIEGELPPWLAGSLLRTGPSKWDLGAQRLNHWFDGLAMLHRFSIRDGEVSYGNRFLRGKAFRAAEQTGRLGFQEFASDPCRSLFRRLATLFVTPEITDNGAINITRLGEQYMAMTAVAVAALTIYDMCKAVDREMVFTDVCLLEKAGGKSGRYVRDEKGSAS